MPINVLTPADAVNNYLDQRINNLRRVLVRNLAIHGTQGVNEARTRGKYKDRTGNLRSSIGFVVTLDGEAMSTSDFATVKQGVQGSAQGKELTMQLVDSFPHGAAIIAVAGMEYAKYVSDRGLDVLDSMKLYLEREVPKMIEKFKKM